MSDGAGNITLLVFVYWVGSRWLHEVAHAAAIYAGMKAEVRRSRMNPLTYTNWLHHWVMPSFGLLLLTMPLPGAMVTVKAEDLRNRVWRSLVAAAGQIVTFGLLAVVWRRQADFTGDTTALAYWFWIELVGAGLNLLPLPGLDGYGMVEPWLPLGWRDYWRDKKHYGPILMLALLLPEGVRSMLRIQPGDVYLPPNAGLLMTVLFVSLVGAARYGQQLNEEQPVGDDKPKSEGVLLADLAKIEGMVAANPRQVSAGLWMQRGHILQKLERWEEAIAVYEQAVVYHPQNVQVWCNRGVLLAKRDLYDEALTCYVQASDLGADNVETWHYQADALLELKRYELAVAVFDKILTVMPHDGHILADRGYALLQLERIGEARRSLAAAVKLEPNEYNYFWYAKVLGELGEWDEAVKVAQFAVAYNSQSYLLADLLVNLQRRARDFEGALRSCDGLLRKFVRADVLASRKAMVRLQMNQPEVALGLLAVVPREALTLMDLRLRCRLYYQAGDYEAALADCLGALEPEPEQPIALELYGLILEAMGKGGQAIGVYRKLLAVCPDWFWVRIRLGILLLERRQLGSAREMFAIVLEERPEDGDVLYLQGLTLVELGWVDEGREVLGRLLTIVPGHELGRRVYASVIRESK